MSQSYTGMSHLQRNVTLTEEWHTSTEECHKLTETERNVTLTEERHVGGAVADELDERPAHESADRAVRGDDVDDGHHRVQQAHHHCQQHLKLFVCLLFISDTHTVSIEPLSSIYIIYSLNMNRNHQGNPG